MPCTGPAVAPAPACCRCASLTAHIGLLCHALPGYSPWHLASPVHCFTLQGVLSTGTVWALFHLWTMATIGKLITQRRCLIWWPELHAVCISHTHSTSLSLPCAHHKGCPRYQHQPRSYLRLKSMVRSTHTKGASNGGHPLSPAHISYPYLATVPTFCTPHGPPSPYAHCVSATPPLFLP